jgi:predicted ester cyclase
MTGRRPTGRDDLVGFRRTVMAAFPDQTFEIVDILAEIDRVAAPIRPITARSWAYRRPGSQ